MANDTKIKIALKEPALLADTPVYLNEETIILGFPKEFKKKWIQSLDFLFLKILLVTFIVEVSLIFFLTTVLKTTRKPVNVEKIQKRYARLLLNKSPEPKPSSTSQINSEPTSSAIAATIAEPAPPIAEENGMETENAVNIPATRKTGKISSANNVSSMESSQRSSAYASALSRKVSQTGIMRYLISSSNSGYEEELAAVYSNADINSQKLEQALGEMNLVRINSPGASFQAITSEQLDVLKKLKGSSVAIEAIEEIEALNHLEKIKAEKEGKIENLDYQRDELLIPHKTSAKMRSPEQVAKVVHSHARVIQDCYRQATRRNPNLKGKVTVRISVAPEGNVVDVQILESSIENEKMLRCIINRIRRWRDFGAINESAGIQHYRQSYVFGY